MLVSIYLAETPEDKSTEVSCSVSDIMSSKLDPDDIHGNRLKLGLSGSIDYRNLI